MMDCPKCKKPIVVIRENNGEWHAVCGCTATVGFWLEPLIEKHIQAVSDEKKRSDNPSVPVADMEQNPCHEIKG
jgi:ribosomal protein L37AE/L43A